MRRMQSKTNFKHKIPSRAVIRIKKFIQRFKTELLSNRSRNHFFKDQL